MGDLAEAIGAEIGLDEEHQQGLMAAGYLHDIGKIIVPIEILCKPTKLSPEEYNLVKNHVQAGYNLLKGVKFPWPITDPVLQHHERLDGSGYPNGLKEDQISLEGRIIAVADVIDAMGCNRPYRISPGIEKGLVSFPAARQLPRVRGGLCVRLWTVLPRPTDAPWPHCSLSCPILSPT